MMMQRSALAVAMTCASALVGGAAHGQTVTIPPAASVDNDPATVADIVVTAQRRSERMQDVPVTMTALTGERLDRAGAVRADDIANLTPGLTVGSFTPTRPQIFIRGIGTRQIDIGSDPSIGVFVDDVYVGRVSGQMTGLADLERVEVLKGPQGTLYGRNTIGGAISIVTRAPGSTPDAYLDAGIGDYGYFDARGSASGPIVDDALYGRLSFFRTKRDGYVRNTTTGGRAQGIDQYDIRGKLLFDRGGPFTATLIVDTLHDSSPGQQGKSAGPDVFLRSPLATLPAIDPDPLQERYDVDSTTSQRISQYVGRLEWQGSAVALTAITAYRRSRLAQDGEVDYTILDDARQTTRERSSELSQEVRVASQPGGALTFGDRIRWIGGVYYLRDKATRTDVFTFGRDSLPVFIANFAGLPLTSIGNGTTLDRTAESTAAFAEITWKLFPTVELVTGARYSRESKRGIYSATTTAPGLPLIPAAFDIPLDRRWTSVDPRVTLDWRPVRDVLLYATYSEGFKSGGFQFSVTDPDLARRIFDPEHVRYVEGGMKAELLQRRLQVNASLFSYAYDNLQTQRTVAQASGGATTIVENAASSTIRGAEIQATAVPLRDLTITAGLTLLHARYDRYDAGDGTDFSGTRMVRAPDLTTNLAIDYDPLIGRDVRLIAHADWFHTSSFYFEPGETRVLPSNRQGAYDLLNVRLGLGLGRWSVTGFVTNLLDRRYRAANDIRPGVVTPFGAIGPQSAGYYAAPRMTGVRVAWRY